MSRFLDETLLPAPYHRASDIDLGHHLLHQPATRGTKHHLGWFAAMSVIRRGKRTLFEG
jgi:hypothetical protein